MLPRAHKVIRKRDVEELAKTGRRFSSVFFIVKVKKNTTGNSRFIIIVSTKVSKKAVARNRVRRRVREIIRLALLPLARPFDVMVIVKQEALAATYQQLFDDLTMLYEKSTTVYKPYRR